jgi:hypothetical protein
MDAGTSLLLRSPWPGLVLLSLCLLFLLRHLLLLSFFLVFLATLISHTCSLSAIMTRDAFLRSDLAGVFRHHDESQHLRPFGHDIAHNLAGFAVRIHSRVADGPRDTGGNERDRQRVIDDETRERAARPGVRLPAFRGADFIEVLSRDDDEEGSEPVGGEFPIALQIALKELAFL